MADIKFQLKTGYLVNYNGEIEDNYEIKKINYFTIYRKPHLFNLFRKQISYYIHWTEKPISPKQKWGNIYNSQIFTSKKSAKDYKAKQIEKDRKEETRSKVDNLQSELDEIKKTL